MEPLNDDELDMMLQAWRVPLAPTQDLSKLQRAWKWISKGSVRLPVPVVLTALVAMVCLMCFAVRAPDISRPTESSVSDFRPVKRVQVRIIKGENDERN